MSDDNAPPPQEYLVHAVTLVPALAKVLVFPNGDVEVSLQGVPDASRHGACVTLRGPVNVTGQKAAYLSAMVSQKALQLILEATQRTLDEGGFGMLAATQPAPEGPHS